MLARVRNVNGKSAFQGRGAVAGGCLPIFFLKNISFSFI